jgi:hypothetical protein
MPTNRLASSVSPAMPTLTLGFQVKFSFIQYVTPMETYYSVTLASSLSEAQTKRELLSICIV